MFVYNLDELTVVYDTLEYLKDTYDITVKGIVGAKNIEEVKNVINNVIDDVISKVDDAEEVEKLQNIKLK